jgi:hypothetical protein
MAVRVLDEQQRTFLAPLSEAEREVLADLLNRLFLARVGRGSSAAPDADSAGGQTP